MAFISNFADQAVVLPLATVAALGLGLARWWRGLGAWCVAVGGTLLAMLVLKILGVELAMHLGLPRPISPSGHVAGGCAVYGGMAVLLLRDRVPGPLMAAVPLLLVLVIGASRISLGAHTPGEVLAGSIVGLLGVGTLARLAGPRPSRTPWPLLAALCGTVLAFHGAHVPAEQMIHQALSVR